MLMCVRQILCGLSEMKHIFLPDIPYECYWMVRILGEGFDLGDIPEDVLEDLEAIAEEISADTRRAGKRKVKLPSSRDLAEIVAEAAMMARGVDPAEFPEIVLKLLKEKGFYTKYVNEKRIWRVYESLVRRRVIPDTLGVVMW